METKITSSDMTISEFFNEKCIFVTGGTGFVGKLVIEKLLRSCPGIDNIYVLCRPLKDKPINDRYQEIISSKDFDLLRDKNLQALSKIILIEGDMAKLELGISKKDQEILKEKVSVVINSAATINFNENLKVAVNTNLRSLNELLDLCRQMKNLKVRHQW
jgi:fatty acyl-CoA reductase